MLGKEIWSVVVGRKGSAVEQRDETEVVLSLIFASQAGEAPELEGSDLSSESPCQLLCKEEVWSLEADLEELEILLQPLLIISS